MTDRAEEIAREIPLLPNQQHSIAAKIRAYGDEQRGDAYNSGYVDGLTNGAEEMRERAASKMMPGEIRDAIRALPLEKP